MAGLGKRDWRAQWFAALCAGVSTYAFTAPALAQTPPATQSVGRVRFDIEAQPLAASLTAFARQAGLNALYPDALVGAYRAPALHGDYTREAALAALLAEAPLRGEITRQGGVALHPFQQTAFTNSGNSQGGATPGAPADEANANSNSNGEPDAVATIIVTGTRLHGAAPAGANLIGIDRAGIEQSGRTTLQDVLQTLPQVFPGSQNELTQLNSNASGGNFALGSSVDLRGLGADATVALLNGRRLAPAGLGNFVDISAIPVAAIERIDVLADGASATYGADAVGGVVNVIMRRDLDHPETTLRYGGADSMSEIDVAHVFGAHWEGGALVAGYDYRHRDALAAADRDFAANSDLTPFGGSNFSRFAASPGNIVRVGANPVTLAIPAGQNGLNLTAADLLPGHINLQNANQGAFLLPEQESHALFLSAHHDVTANVSLFLDLLGSLRDGHAEKTQLGGAVPVPETNYYRQQNGLFAGQGPIFINYFFGNDLGPTRTDTESKTLASAFGADVSFANDWRLQPSLSYGRHTDHVHGSNFADSSAIFAALASSDPATAFNPFGDGGDTAASALPALTFTQNIDNHAELVTYALSADGPLFELPGGHARLGMGVERRRETFSITQRETHSGVSSLIPGQAPGQRTTDAFYAEAFLPLLANFDVSLSLRREDSSDFGEATTPKIGARLALTPDLTFRATWGKSFKAPGFNDLLGGSAALIDEVPGFFDPAATNGSTGLLDIVGANPSLKPERAETWTAGFDLHPAWLDGFKLSATYFDIDFTDRIATPGFILDAFQNPQNYAGFFVRNPTPAQIAAALALTPNVVGTIPPDGIEVIYDERLTNLAALRVRGIDLSASYAMTTSLGDLSIFASASGLFQYSRQSNPSLPASDLLNTIGNPIDWRIHAGFSLDAAPWRFAAAVNYDDSYRDNLSSPNRRIDSWTTVDARISRRFNTHADGAASELALDVRNLADTDPPFANNAVGMGFDTLNASPVGRAIMLELRQQW